MKNAFRFKDENTVAIVLIYKGQEYETLISREDLEHVQSFDGRWYLSKRNNTSYVVGYDKIDGKRKIIHLHRWIMNPPKDKHIDHINGNGLDNTRDNLRNASPSQNNRNSEVVRSSTGAKGVYKNHTTYSSRINVVGKEIHLENGKRPDLLSITSYASRAKYLPFSRERYEYLKSGKTLKDVANIHFPNEYKVVEAFAEHGITEFDFSPYQTNPVDPNWSYSI